MNEIEQAIQFIQDRRDSSNQWAEYLSSDSDKQVEPSDLGDVDFYRGQVAKFDQVLEVLRSIQPAISSVV